MVFIILCVLSLLKLCEPEVVKAGVYDNAYTYYQHYGKEMIFLPGADNQGEIYYATKAKKNPHATTRYMTLGWKLRLFNSDGALVETLYYKLDGKYMTSVDIRQINGYAYCLYRVSLSNIKNRLSQAGLKALENPNCSIVFDACTTTKLNGVVQGGMTDEGPSWGTVYTTYNGIVNAQNWTSDTRESLKSYYNKNVEGLFYEVLLEEDAGIRQVYGEGKYCFGTLVTVSAETEDGYHFLNWTGNHGSPREAFSFEIRGSDVTLTAHAKENDYSIQYEGNGGVGNIAPQKAQYTQSMVLPTGGFSLSGASLCGWSLLTEDGEQYFSIGQTVFVKELVDRLNLQRKNEAVVTLKAVWDQGPLIITEHIYVPRKAALEGRVTEEWLSQRVQAIDREDGEIPYGRREGASFFIEDYQAVRYTEIESEGIVKENFIAEDTAGNSTNKCIDIHVVDTSMHQADKFTGRVRFINKKYFKDEKGNLLSEIMGGLAEDSIWRWDESYRQLLEELFS